VTHVVIFNIIKHHHHHHQARVITEATSPYRIQYASQSWCELFGHDPFKIQGQSCKLLQGNDTEVDRLNELITGVKLGRAGSTTLTNYNAEGEKVVICLRLYPLYTDSILTHYLGEFMCILKYIF
jgi:PAS domain-containing protein